jgi:hypothetical protein
MNGQWCAIIGQVLKSPLITTILPELYSNNKKITDID